MSRPLAITLMLLTTIAANSRAQPISVGPGSTPQGDYLRGVGVAAYGIGMGNLLDAQANSINVDTGIRLNEYIASVLKNEAAENAQRRAARIERDRELYNKEQKRILESPEARDVDKGNALNAVLEQMNAGLIQESSHRYANVPLSVDQVRRIPFKLAAKGIKSFSMYRLTVKHKGQWPPAFQDRQFDRERRTYELALDHVLDQHVHTDAQIEAINSLKSAVSALSDRLEQVRGLHVGDPRYLEARATLRELDAMVEMLKRHKLQLALVDLDQYHGTTVNDLRVFMRNHGLQFAVAESKEERELYPELYTKLRIHHDKVTGAAGEGDKN